MSQNLENIRKGNERFVAESGDGLFNFVRGQDPKIVVLSCADSRVVPEKIFDAGIGDIFVVRVAGNVAFEPSVLESLEYAVAHLDIHELIIMGHTNCGAVEAAIKNMESGSRPSPLLKEIGAGFVDGVDPVLASLNRQLRLLPERSAVIKNALESGGLNLRGAMYDLTTGNVEFL